MTGFAVDQRQPGIGGNLFSVDGHLKVAVNLVMLMALSETVGIADIIGVKTADNELFVGANGQKGVIGP